MKRYDYLIVGSGLFGSVFAYIAAQKGKKVLVIEKRDHIAGNIFTERVKGINVHKYGAHIFHTNDKDVWNFVNKFSEFNRYTNSPVANYCNELYSLPFNMYTFNKMWNVISPDDAKRIISEQISKSKVVNPKNLEEQAISLVGYDIYEKLIKHYTEKQWGRPCSELPAFIIKRIPIRYTYDNNYFNALYQGIPIGGYTNMISKMLEGVEVRVGIDYLSNKDYWNSIADKVVYTGAIDALFEYAYGKLEYRTVHFETEYLESNNFQGNAVVNYTDSQTPWTRIIEHKWFDFGKDIIGNDIEGTIISREYSTEWRFGDEPYYPVNDDRNIALYNKYLDSAKRLNNIILGGRLAEYKYYDMDKVIARAFEVCKQEFCNKSFINE